MASLWDAATTFLLSPHSVTKYTKQKETKSEGGKELSLLQNALLHPEVYPDLQEVTTSARLPSAPPIVAERPLKKSITRK